MRLVLSALLLLASAAALAEWVEVARTSIDQTTHYLDRATIKRNGHIRRAEGLTVRQAPDQDGALSFRTLSEFDCDKKRFRLLRLTYFRGKMGDGDVLLNHDGPSEWFTIKPRSVGAGQMKFVCSQ